jgi:NADH-quinone oxidoreductase subunit L
VDLPRTLGSLPVFSSFLETVLPKPAEAPPSLGTEALLSVITSALSLLGIYVAYLLYARTPRFAETPARTPWGAGLQGFWLNGWGFDRLYDTLIVRPYVWLTEALARDWLDLYSTAIARFATSCYRLLSATETGQVRWYAAGIAVGAVIVVAIGVLL